MWKNSLRNFLVDEGHEILEWAKCGDDYLSAVPTLLWAVGAIAFSHRLLNAMFRRFLFRRVPIWEQILQHLLFIWMVLYSLHFWHVLVRILKALVEYYDKDVTGDHFPLLEIDITHSLSVNIILSVNFMSVVLCLDEILDKDSRGLNFMQQSVIWLCGATPLAIYMYSKQRSSEPPLMIWITTNPWQRREMGPYGYYLNRPFSTMESYNNLSQQDRTLMLRRAHSDTNITVKEPPRKRRSSKSV